MSEYTGPNYGFTIGEFESGWDRPEPTPEEFTAKWKRKSRAAGDGPLPDNALAIRRYLAREAKALGWELDDLVGSLRPGRLDDPGKQRRALLGALVVSAQGRGASGPAVGRALGVSKMTVSRLVAPVAGSR